MKLPSLLHTGFALLVIGAFIAGRSLQAPPSPPVPKSILAPATTNPAGAAADGDAGGARSDAPLDSDQAGEVIQQMISRTTEYEQIRVACALIPKITVENWRGVFDRLDSLKDKENPLLKDCATYHLLMERIGMVAGKMLLDEQMAKPDWDRLTLFFLLSGWSEKDPKSATEWIGRIDPKIQETLIPGVVFGLARVDPAMAVGLAVQGKSFQQDSDATNIVLETIQAGGLRAGQQLIDSLEARTDLSMPDKGRVFGSFALVKAEANAAAGKPLATLDWMAQYVGHDVMGPFVTTKLLAQAANVDFPRRSTGCRKTGRNFLLSSRRRPSRPSAASGSRKIRSNSPRG